MSWLQAFFPNDQHPDHHKPLDGLRGLAVLMVVFGHGNNHGLGPFGDHSLLIRGKLGVYLFFVLSAYLLDRQIIKMFQQERASWDYWFYYISRRILRIFPLFFLALIVFRLANASGLNVVIYEWQEVWQDPIPSIRLGRVKLPKLPTQKVSLGASTFSFSIEAGQS